MLMVRTGLTPRKVIKTYNKKAIMFVTAPTTAYLMNSLEHLKDNPFPVLEQSTKHVLPKMARPTMSFAFLRVSNA